MLYYYRLFKCCKSDAVVVSAAPIPSAPFGALGKVEDEVMTEVAANEEEVAEDEAAAKGYNCCGI